MRSLCCRRRDEFASSIELDDLGAYFGTAIAENGTQMTAMLPLLLLALVFFSQSSAARRPGNRLRAMHANAEPLDCEARC